MLSYFKTFAVVFTTLLTFIFAQADVTLSIDGSSLNYDSNADIYGIQFNHDGCAASAFGGDAAASGFTISASAGVVLGFSMTADFIPAGSGVLTVLNFTDITAGITDLSLGSGALTAPGGVEYQTNVSGSINHDPYSLLLAIKSREDS